MRLSDFDWAPGWTLYDSEAEILPFAAGYPGAGGSCRVALQVGDDGVARVYAWPQTPGLFGCHQLCVSGLQLAVYAGMPPQEVWESVMRGSDEGE